MFPGRYSSIRMKSERIFAAMLMLIAVALLASCSSVRLSYDNAGFLLRVAANRYLALTDEQAADFKARFAALHDWHREQELSRYAVIFQSAGEKLSDGLTREEVEWAIAALQTRARVLAERAANALAPLLVTLEPAQLAVMEKKFAEDNAGFAKKYLAGDGVKQLQGRAEQIATTLSDWIGELSPVQERLIEGMAKQFPEFPVLRFQERQRWQNEFIALLKENHDARILEPKLRVLLMNWEASYSEEYARARKSYEEGFMQLILALDKTLTSLQRQQAVGRLESFATDFRSLALDKALVRN